MGNRREIGGKLEGDRWDIGREIRGKLEGNWREIDGKLEGDSWEIGGSCKR